MAAIGDINTEVESVDDIELISEALNQTEAWGKNDACNYGHIYRYDYFPLQ